MNIGDDAPLRLAALTALAKYAPRRPGRTAMMKLAYFLQELKGAPLGYNFRLYNFGPYDAQVLEDLRVAELRGALKASQYAHPQGYGYDIEPGDQADDVVAAAPEIGSINDAIRWVASEFGSRSAIDLEMSSTIIFVDREGAETGEALTTHEIARRVKSIKPRLQELNIIGEAERLGMKKLLRSVQKF